MANQEFEARFSVDGTLLSARRKSEAGTAPDYVDGRGNQLTVMHDVPFYWDAWDIMPHHLTHAPYHPSVVAVAEGAVAKRKRGDEEAASEALHRPLNRPRVVLADDSIVTVEFPMLAISDSSLVQQQVTLEAGACELRFATWVDWHESHKVLKAQFPLNIRASTATYGTAFGHLERSTRANTSWDAAKYEVRRMQQRVTQYLHACVALVSQVPAHQWVDVSQTGRGATLVSDHKYGFSVHDNVASVVCNCECNSWAEANT